MTSDISRTPILRDTERLHNDAKRIIEFYCYAHNVHYCQGMLEVLLPFLFMKSNDDAAKTTTASIFAEAMSSDMNATMVENVSQPLV